MPWPIGANALRRLFFLGVVGTSGLFLRSTFGSGGIALRFWAGLIALLVFLAFLIGWTARHGDEHRQHLSVAQGRIRAQIQIVPKCQLGGVDFVAFRHTGQCVFVTHLDRDLFLHKLR